MVRANALRLFGWAFPILKPQSFPFQKKKVCIFPSCPGMCMPCRSFQRRSTGRRCPCSQEKQLLAPPVAVGRRCRRRSPGSRSQACPVVTPFSVVRCRIHGGAGPSRLLICTPRRHRKIKGTPLELVAILSSRITAFHESEGRWNGMECNRTDTIVIPFHRGKKKRKDGPGNDACIPKDPNGQLQCKNCIWHECSAGRGVETRDP